MPECHPQFDSNLLLAPARQIASDQLSTFSATNTDHSSPSYTAHDAQYSTPDSDGRTESPSSDQLHLDATQGELSPDVATSSDRDETPEEPEDIKDIKPVIANVENDLQKILRMTAPFNSESADVKPTPPQLNSLLAAFNNQLLSSKLGSSFLDLASQTQSPPTIAPPAPPPPPAPVQQTQQPTKRKRQRRNPVWPYFDVIDGTAKCKQCLYTTKSVFSTNLKVHLRSHHRSDYEKVIAAEDALNLNALLMSGNASKLLNPDMTRKRIPPMTSSILMTINKLASQQNEDNPLTSVLRQTLAAGTLQQQLQMAQQQQQRPAQQIPLNAANLAALNNLAKMNQSNNSVSSIPGMPGADSLFSQFSFPQQVKSDSPAPHGTDSNGMPQPKRRRLRRHPVWMFFKDLEDRMVGCINCSFRTGSAFSTNLKMHLKAHHKEDYERVLQMEEEMRKEEGIPNNNKKTELIDFIRSGGNASTLPNANSSPKTASMVQHFILNSQRGAQVKQEKMDEDPYNGMSMSEKLAALVGLPPTSAASIEAEVPEEKPQIALNPLEEFRRAIVANMGLQPPPQEQTLVNLNGTIIQSDAKSTSSASTDVSGDDKKTERDRALARFWLEQGGNDELLNSDVFKALMDTLIEEKPEEEEEAESTPSTSSTKEEEKNTVSAGSLSVSAVFDISTLSFESLFDALVSFQKSLGLSEAVACSVLTDLLRNSVKNDEERATVETVAAGLERIAALDQEQDKQERTRKLVSEKMKLKRLFETPQQRAQRLERMRARYQSIKGVEPQRRERCGEESPEAKEERLRRLREYQRKRLERELPEQRERRLAKMRLNQKKRRERQNAERVAQGGIDLLRALAPDYEVPDASQLASLVDEDSQLAMSMN